MNELKKSSEQDIYLEPKEQIIENTKSVDEHTLAFAQTNEMVMENDKIKLISEFGKYRRDASGVKY